jgi:hypothetical protein
MGKAKKPLELPPDWDPEVCLLAKTTENGVFHESRKGAGLAARLVASGTPVDIALAERVLEAVLRCQERHENDPHYGNFFWMAEDKVVQDLNAVEFCLEHLIPMLLQHPDRLSPDWQARVRESIRLGLDEIRRLDVLAAYTNITLLDILNSSLGGELLGDQEIAARGYKKLVQWMALTDHNGIPFEYNSPTYSAVSIRALKRLIDLVQHEETRARARTALARLGLSACLHIHQRTGRWAGPHSRAYQPSVVCETAPEIEMVRAWIAEGTLPAWMAAVLDARPKEMEVTETAFVDRQLSITTYHSRSFCLGVSSTEQGGQSDVWMVHFHRPESDRGGTGRAGVVYSRYLLNDKWLGDFYHATDRTKSRNLIEEGQFYGVQSGPRAIGLYTPRRLGVISSAKLALIWTRRDLVDEIWVGDQKVESLPATVEPGKVIVVGSGEALVAILPLTRTDLGRSAPIRLVEVGGDLVLELYNYLGPQKAFWEMGWPGAFYKGRPQCGFYSEVAERSAYTDGSAFARIIASGTLHDDVEPPYVYAGEGERTWTVEYERDRQMLGIEVDLMLWRLKRRWTQEGDVGWPMLESPVARQAKGGKVAVGQATLECGNEAAWLFACPERELWAAGYHGPRPAPLRLTLPTGSVQIQAMGTGTVVWHAGQLSVDAVGLHGPPTIQPPLTSPTPSQTQSPE